MSWRGSAAERSRYRRLVEPRNQRITMWIWMQRGSGFRCDEMPEVIATRFSLWSDTPRVLPQQPHEPCLLEVVIGGQGLGQTALLHDDEAGAVHQAPFLVGT